jgi:hypothetical protein
MVLLLVPIASAEYVYLVDLRYDGGKVSYSDVSIIGGKPPNYLEFEEGYVGKVIDFNGKELFNFEFDFPLRVFDSDIHFLEQVDHRIVVPYFETGKHLNIERKQRLNNSLILQIPLQDFSQCNQNYVCETKGSYEENHKACPSDCISGGKDNLCEFSMDGVCDPDCERDFECNGRIKDKLIIQSLVGMYEKEIIGYENLDVEDEKLNSNIKSQISQRKERISYLNPSRFVSISLGFLLFVLIIFYLLHRKHHLRQIIRFKS